MSCALENCTPGKVWLVLAAISVLASVNQGWNAFVSTLVWELIVGLGVKWLCHGCYYNILWTLLVIFSGLPILAMAAAIILAGKDTPDKK